MEKETDDISAEYQELIMELRLLGGKTLLNIRDALRGNSGFSEKFSHTTVARWLKVKTPNKDQFLRVELAVAVLRKSKKEPEWII